MPVKAAGYARTHWEDGIATVGDRGTAIIFMVDLIDLCVDKGDNDHFAIVCEIAWYLERDVGLSLTTALW